MLRLGRDGARSRADRGSDGERRRRLRPPSAYEAAAIAIAVVFAGGIAFAEIPSDGVISACYTKSGGTLRIIDATTGKCSSKETALNWNVQGVPGLPGQDGQDGVDGQDGADGAPGISGYELVTAESTAISFDGNRLDVRASCPAGKKFLGGGHAFYLVPDGFAPQYTPADRVNALPEVSFDGTHRYYVTVIHPIPAGTGAKLEAVAACANVAS